MALGNTELADVIVPAIWTPYVQQMTEQKSRLIQSGVITRDASLDAFLAGAGLTMNSPSFRDLDNDEENVSSDIGPDSAPNKIGTDMEVAVRLSRNNSWSTSDLVSALIGTDPADAIAQRVSAYWVRREQVAFMSLVKGIFADNAAAPTATEHVLNDMTFDVRGAAYSRGVTDFTAEGFVDATLTMGDSMESLGTVFVHSIVYGRMVKNNMIDFIRDSTNTMQIPSFLGREVIVDDAMPNSAGVFESWLFGKGSVRMGKGSPKVPTAVKRDEKANNGGGEEVLHNRVEWCLHAEGHKYLGAAPSGGPSNAATANNLANAGSWQRAFRERKMIKIARFITREF